MAVRVTKAEVKLIIDTDVSDDVLDALILPANLIVTDQLTDSGHSVALLKEIEKWLTAHLIKMSWERATIREEIGGDTKEQYSKLGLNLDASTYGQTVKMLDTSGILFRLGQIKSTINAVTSFEDT